jgi:hypothetical protein
MDRTSRWLWYANVTALTVLLARLAITRLFRVYPFLFIYFLVDLGGSLTLIQIPYLSNSYAVTYMALRSITHIVAIVVVLEIYRVALAKHPGLAGFGRASVLTITVVMTVVAAIGTVLDKNVLKGQSAVVHRFFTLERSLDLILLLFLLLISAFITWFPVELSRNAILSLVGFSIFYFTRAAGLLAINLLPPAQLATLNDGLLGMSLVILVAWALALRPERAGANTVAGHSWDPAAFGRVSRQLDAINAALVRFGWR